MLKGRDWGKDEVWNEKSERRCWWYWVCGEIDERKYDIYKDGEVHVIFSTLFLLDNSSYFND